MEPSAASFRKFNAITIVAIYLLILVGGLVRNTESGMGCPDWPKCFGNYYPPLSESQLPENYRDIYLEKRLEKNERLKKTLLSLGFTDLAREFSNTKQVSEDHRFELKTAWIEYANRLVGVVIGILITITTFKSFRFYKSNRFMVLRALFSFLLVIFIGWTGSLVVSTNLVPGFVSFHMSLSLLLLAVMILQHFKVREVHEGSFSNSERHWIMALFVLYLPQLLLGIQVRELVDELTFHGVPATEWIGNMDWMFYVHRSYNLLLLGMAYVIYRMTKMSSNSLGTMLLRYIIYLMVFMGLSGAVMSYLSFPKLVQPLHLVSAALLFGCLFYLFLQSRNQSKVVQ